MKKKITVFLILLSACICNYATAATYYVSPTGDNTTGDGSYGNPWRHPYYGCTHMASGDTLVLMDGTYPTESGGARTWSNQIRPPSGIDADHYTIVRAENDGMAVLDYDGGADVTGYDAAISICSLTGYGGTVSYIQVEGIKVINTTQAVSTYDCAYIKIKRIGCISSAGSSAYAEPFLVGQYSHYVLLEDCWVSGQIRYGFMCIGLRQYAGDDTSHIIFRRCIARTDYCINGQPHADFCAYGGEDTGLSTVDNIIFQNCVAIDWNPGSGMTDIYGGYYNPKYTKQITYRGCMALNLKPNGGAQGSIGAGFYTLDNYRQNIGPTTLTNCVAWDVSGMGIYWDRGGEAGVRSVTATADQCTLGKLNTPYGYIWDRDYANGDWIISTLSNSIIDSTNCTNDTDLNVEDYNSYNLVSPSVIATNYITTANGQLYIVRVEDGSTCDGTGDGGKDRGANILKRWGTDGTLWGETGYDTESAVDLWPWPYEDRIRDDFRTANAPVPTAYPTTNDTTRGFCATGVTLTSYIWEYEGNEMPGDIYAPDETSPSAISDLAAVTGAGTGDIDLTWTAPGDDAATGTATSYDVRHYSAEITDENWAAATPVTGEPTPLVASTGQGMTISNLTPGDTYHFAIKTSDEVPNVSAISNSPSATAGTEPPTAKGVTFSGCYPQ